MPDWRIPEQHLVGAYEAGRHAFESHRSPSDCPAYAIGEQGRPWREKWRRGYADAAIKAGQPDPFAPPPPEHSAGRKQPLRTGRRSGR